MTDTITLTGLVATQPKHILTTEGLAITNFRLASTQRRFDKATGRWVDGETNWYTITAFRQLALNASACLARGERVIVTGRLKLRSWDNGERSGITVEVEAEAIGHDLSWGTSAYSRNISVSELAEPTAATEQNPTAAPEGQTASDPVVDSTPLPF